LELSFPLHYGSHFKGEAVVTVRGFVRTAGNFCWHNCWWFVLAISVVGISAVSIFAYIQLGPGRSFEQTSQLIENTLLALGLVTVILLIAQLRQTASWNSVLSYHEYFGELPNNQRAEDLYSVLQRLNIPVPSAAEPMSKENAGKVWDDTGLASPDGVFRLVGRRVVREYLNDYEEFCGAILAGVVNEPYARELEARRVIGANYGFEEIVKLYRAEIAEKPVAKPQTEQAARNLLAFRQKPYQELRRVATSWRRRREKEYQKLAKKRKSIQRYLEEDDELDGVGRST
jgi:hypothetical protein